MLLVLSFYLYFGLDSAVRSVYVKVYLISAPHSEIRVFTYNVLRKYIYISNQSLILFSFCNICRISDLGLLRTSIIPPVTFLFIIMMYSAIWRMGRYRLSLRRFTFGHISLSTVLVFVYLLLLCRSGVGGGLRCVFIF